VQAFVDRLTDAPSSRKWVERRAKLLLLDAMETLLADVQLQGWTVLTSDIRSDEAIVRALNDTAASLGTPAKGRGGAVLERIVPRSRSTAHSESQSAKFGFEAIPLHVELSHRTTPCRYVVLGCLDAGLHACETTLLDWRTLALTTTETLQLKGAALLVRNGRQSFYTTAMPADGGYLRYDEGCIGAIDERGHSALDIVRKHLSASVPVVHEWERGHILVIDNWRMLHGRKAAHPESSRTLLRKLVDAG
jgi:hypothetical protein